MTLEEFKQTEIGEVIFEGEDHMIVVEGKINGRFIFIENGEELSISYKNVQPFMID